MSGEDPNDLTIRTYREHFSRYVERTVPVVSGEFGAWMDAFASLLPKDGTLLELGSATGRDARYLASKGLKVICTDVVSEALCRLAEQGFATATFDFRDAPPSEWAQAFDGVFANAVLLHAPQPVFEKALRSISRIVKRGGVIALSLKTGSGSGISMEKMDAPRYYAYHSKQDLEATLSRVGYEVVRIDLVDEGKWLLVLLRN